MTDYEAALELLKLVLEKCSDAALDAAGGKEQLFALYRECLAAVRGKAE